MNDTVATVDVPPPTAARLDRFSVAGVFAVAGGALARHLPLCLGLALLIHVPLGLVLAAPVLFDLSEWGDQAFGALMMGTAVLCGQLTTAALAPAMQAWVRRERPGWSQTLRACGRSLGPTLATVVLVAVATGAALSLMWFVGFFVAVRLWVAIPAAAVERLGPWPAVTRSAELAQGFGWQIFIVVALTLAFIVGGYYGFFSLLHDGIDFGAYLAVLAGTYVFASFGAAVAAVLAGVSYAALRQDEVVIDGEDTVAAFD